MDTSDGTRYRDFGRCRALVDMVKTKSVLERPYLMAKSQLARRHRHVTVSLAFGSRLLCDFLGAAAKRALRRKENS